MTLYLDANATTPLDPRVQAEIVRCFEQEFGNPGSPHRFGRKAKRTVHRARDQIATAVGVRRHEVIFTSGATESNNLAILGLAAHGQAVGKRHLISTQIEHKAVLEPLQHLQQQGFDLTLIPPASTGQVVAEDILKAVREDTLLVSVMHVNNETGICQPIREIADGLADRQVLFHVDAAQGFGKRNADLTHERIDLISISSHKIHGPQGVGALVTRRRRGDLPPLKPLMYGGGQEFGLRPGTLPVSLIAGFGLAAELANQEAEVRSTHCKELRGMFLEQLRPLDFTIHGCPDLALPHVVNVSFSGWSADEVIEALDDVAAVSDGSACTSVCATASHVLTAMGIRPPEIDGAVRISWSHLTRPDQLVSAADELRQRLT